ncbi:MAG: DUF3365 domain-containing protein [Calditrichae bacterium]|nr:DUF3365 domain-containing protein [Calditrichia bacterium]
MKKLSFALIVVLLVSVSCTKDSTLEEKLTETERTKIQKIGEGAATQLIETLKQELMQAIQEKNISGAIEVCNKKAQELTEAIANESNNVLTIKRTTRKYRNPQNAPDELEMQALTYFEERIQTGGEMPSAHFQKFEQNGNWGYRYYRPLKVGGLCLNCHGQEQNMAADVLTHLEKLYPEDKATGYAAGDFRGLVSVTVRLNE